MNRSLQHKRTHVNTRTHNKFTEVNTKLGYVIQTTRKPVMKFNIASQLYGRQY